MNILNELNSIVVSVEELHEILDEADQMHREGRDEPGGGLYLIAGRYKGDFKRAFAVYTRMNLLAELIVSDKSTGWVLPKLPNGMVPTKEELLIVAASHPLIEKDGELVFDEHSFFARVLEITEAEGTA